MKVTETVTITREVNGSTGYGTYLAALENLALVSIDTDPPVPGLVGAPVRRHWTFLAIKAGKASLQLARLRPWDPATLLYEEVLPIDVEPADEADAADAAPGGWSPFAEPDADAQKALKEAVTGRLGIDYEPLLVTSQITKGVNFIFVANARVVQHNAVTYPVLVRVYKAPAEAGKSPPAKIIKTVTLGNPQFIGGYSAFIYVDSEEKAVLEEAFKGFAGSGFKAELVSTQVVAGINYRFAGTQTLVTKDAPKYPVLFTVYKSLSGGPAFTGAEKVYDLV
jgi:predicted secreted protein